MDSDSDMIIWLAGPFLRTGRTLSYCLAIRYHPVHSKNCNQVPPCAQQEFRHCRDWPSWLSTRSFRAHTGHWYPASPWPSNRRSRLGGWRLTCPDGMSASSSITWDLTPSSQKCCPCGQLDTHTALLCKATSINPSTIQGRHHCDCPFLLRSLETDSLAQGHTARKWQSGTWVWSYAGFGIMCCHPRQRSR